MKNRKLKLKIANLENEILKLKNANLENENYGHRMRRPIGGMGLPISESEMKKIFNKIFNDDDEPKTPNISSS